MAQAPGVSWNPPYIIDENGQRLYLRDMSRQQYRALFPRLPDKIIKNARYELCPDNTHIWHKSYKIGSMLICLIAVILIPAIPWMYKIECKKCHAIKEKQWGENIAARDSGFAQYPDRNRAIETQTDPAYEYDRRGYHLPQTIHRTA